jgi:hypothetical protein
MSGLALLQGKQALPPAIGDDQGRSRLRTDTCIGVAAVLRANAIEALAVRPFRA